MSAVPIYPGGRYTLTVNPIFLIDSLEDVRLLIEAARAATQEPDAVSSGGMQALLDVIDDKLFETIGSIHRGRHQTGGAA